jgi:hypothetical protein
MKQRRRVDLSLHYQAESIFAMAASSPESSNTDSCFGSGDLAFISTSHQFTALPIIAAQAAA